MAPEDSALVRDLRRAEDPRLLAWGLPEQLLANISDSLAWLVWSKTKDGEKGRNRPNPIPRPGVTSDVDVQRIGSDPLPLDQLDSFIGWDN